MNWRYPAGDREKVPGKFRKVERMWIASANGARLYQPGASPQEQDGFFERRAESPNYVGFLSHFHSPGLQPL